MSYEHYRNLLTRATNLEQATPMPSAEIERFAEIAPLGLQEVWRRHGTDILFGDGRAQLCNPSEMQKILAGWFLGDPEFDIYHLTPFAYNYFGRYYSPTEE